MHWLFTIWLAPLRSLICAKDIETIYVDMKEAPAEWPDPLVGAKVPPDPDSKTMHHKVRVPRFRSESSHHPMKFSHFHCTGDPLLQLMNCSRCTRSQKHRFNQIQAPLLDQFAAKPLADSAAGQGKKPLRRPNAPQTEGSWCFSDGSLDLFWTCWHLQFRNYRTPGLRCLLFMHFAS